MALAQTSQAVELSAYSYDSGSLTSGTIAINGYIDAEAHWPSCAYTSLGMTGPKWMMVYLGQVYSIGYVIVTNTVSGNNQQAG